MQINHPQNRRQLISLLASISTAAMLGGCGGSDAASASPAVAPAASAVAPLLATPTTHPLNLALNFAYLGGQFYGYAAHGAGLTPNLTMGIGQLGVANGARQASFDDPRMADYAAELASDKQAHVVALRAQLGAGTAAQPPLDLSTGATSAFSRAAQASGIVAAGASFDPYASSRNFLLGAFLIENAVAAAYRTILMQTTDAETATVASLLADAIYHGGLIRSLLDDKAAADSTINAALSGLSGMLATFDGSIVGDQTLEGANGPSSNLTDASGRPIPFTRAADQILKALSMSTDGIGGFFPAGVNGMPV